jgi:hypothetical protein
LAVFDRKNGFSIVRADNRNNHNHNNYNDDEAGTFPEKTVPPDTRLADGPALVRTFGV